MSAPATKVDPWLRSTLHMRIAQAVALAAIALGAWVLTTEYAFMVGGVGVLVVLGLVGVLAEWKKRRLARQAVRTMQQQGAWLNWQLPPELWAAHARRTLRRRVPWTVTIGSIGVFIVLLATVLGPWLLGWQPMASGGDLRITAPDGRAFAAVFLGLFGGIGLMADIIHGIVDRAIIRRGNIALIGPQGVIVGGEFLPLANNFLLRFHGVTVSGPPDPVLALHFSELRVGYNAGSGGVTSSRGGKVLSLPIPPGWEDDAERVRAALDERLVPSRPA